MIPNNWLNFERANGQPNFKQIRKAITEKPSQIGHTIMDQNSSINF